jgi:hypothetical protein
MLKGDYGWLYGANIIEEWIRSAAAGEPAAARGDSRRVNGAARAAVDVIWNASTWDPYRVILLRTRINP